MIFLISSCDYIIPRKKIVDKAIVTTTSKEYCHYCRVGEYVVYVQYLNKKPVEKRYRKYGLEKRYGNVKNKINGFKVGDTVYVYRRPFHSSVFIINNNNEKLILDKTNYLTSKLKNK